MVQFNKFHIGELVHNRDTNEDGKIVGFRDTVGIPEYEVIAPIKANHREFGSSLMFGPKRRWSLHLCPPQWTASFAQLRSLPVIAPFTYAQKSSGEM